MTRRRVLLSALAVAIAVGTFLAATTDVFVDGQNCGAALFPKDLEQTPQPADDPIEEDFEVEALRARCSQAITRQRILAVLGVVAVAAVAVAAFRWRPRPRPLPGDPVV